MSSRLMLTLFVIAILLTSALGITLQSVSALQRVENEDNRVTVRLKDGVICGDHKCAPGEWEKMQKEMLEKRQAYAGSLREATKTTTPQAPEVKAPAKEAPKAPMQKAPEKMMPMMHEMKSKSGTLRSIQDPGKGHESHQLAVILPPSDKVYKGILSYAASEDVQLVALTGPLADGEDKGQPIWTPDGKTKFALTFIDPGNAAGTWAFSGNAIAVHTMMNTTFTVSYSVGYSEMDKSDTVKSGTATSIQDPGIGHEGHQLVVVLPPSDKVYTGILTYAASEDVQLVALTGPLADGEDKGQPIWTPDGKTKFALTFIDPGNAAGTWVFSGNAIAVHTKNTTPFTVSYSVVSSQ